MMSRYSSTGTVTGYGLEGRLSIPGRSRELFLAHIVQTDSETHISYPVCTGGKAVVA
jgi:hypothetical protein